MATQCRKKGIMLFTVLMMVAMFLIFIAAMVEDLKAGLFFSSNQSSQQRAYWAAMAGMNYAVQMAKNVPGWEGNTRTSPVTADTYSVVEQYTAQGAVQIKAVKGSLNNEESEFYFAFANLDGSKNLIPAHDAQGRLLSYYCYNNINSDDSLEAFINLNRMQRKFPGKSVYLVVEGRSQRARIILESLYVVDLSNIFPCAVVASGDMNFNLSKPGSKIMISQSSGSPPSIRSNGSITAGNSTSARDVLDLSNGKAYALNQIQINGMQVTPQNESDFGMDVKLGVDSSSSFPSLLWDDMITKYGDPENPASSYAARIKAGTYAFVESKSTAGVYDLVYYDRDYSEDFQPTSDGLPVKQNKASLFTGSGLKVANDGGSLRSYQLEINMQGPTAVESSETCTSMALAAYDWDGSSSSYTSSAKGRPSIKLNASSSKDITTTFCTGGKITVKGELSGTGALVAGGDVNFEGRSQLNPDASTGLAIYAKGDININRITSAGSSVEPNPYLCTAFSKFITSHGETVGNVNSATYSIVHTRITDSEQHGHGWGSFFGNHLHDVLRREYNYGLEETQALVLKLFQKNSTEHNETLTDGMGKPYSRTTYTLTNPSSPDWKSIEYKDSIITGAIYTWKNFHADLAGESLLLQGALVAYGGDPQNHHPGEEAGSGQISIQNGKDITVMYDPNYIGFLAQKSSDFKLKRVMLNILRAQ